MGTGFSPACGEASSARQQGAETDEFFRGARVVKSLIAPKVDSRLRNVSMAFKETSG